MGAGLSGVKGNVVVQPVWVRLDAVICVSISSGHRS